MTLNAAKMPRNLARHLDLYREDWEKFVANNTDNRAVSSPINELRKKGWKEFERIGFPVHRRKNELWRYTDLRPIDQLAFRFDVSSKPLERDELAVRIPLPEEWHNIVFVNGQLDASLSDTSELPPGLRLDSVSQFRDLGELVTCAGNAFASLSSAFMSDGILIDVADGIEVAKPIHVAFATNIGEKELRAVYPRIAVSVGSGGSVTVIESHLAMSVSTYLSVPVVEISLSDEANLVHYRVQIDSEKSYHFATTRVSQNTSSNYKSTSFCVGSAIGRNDIFTMLRGENAESTLHGVYLTTNLQHQDNEISTTHAAAHCTSDQYYKGILSGRSRAVFSGKITVERGAQKTDANQKDLNLLLSHDAEVDTKPSLEIYADDVKCAHGATAGHVDEDTLFYLQSRGVDYSTAQAMLIRGFTAEILAEFEDGALREFLEGKLDELMPALQKASDTIGTA